MSIFNIYKPKQMVTSVINAEGVTIFEKVAFTDGRVNCLRDHAEGLADKLELFYNDYSATKRNIEKVFGLGIMAPHHVETYFVGDESHIYAASCLIDALPEFIKYEDILFCLHTDINFLNR